MKRTLCLWVTSILLLITISCRKKILVCTGNCAEVIIAGYVLDKGKNIVIANQPITVQLYQNQYCIFCSKYNLGSTTTNQQGYFKLPIILDTSLLKNHHLVISTPQPKNTIQYCEPSGPGIVPKANQYASYSFYTLDTNQLNNLQFNFYSKTLLTVELHRRGSYANNTPYIGIETTMDGKTSVWGLDFRASNIDTALTYHTAINQFTKLVVSFKKDTSSPFQSIKDSVYCTANGVNRLTITY